MNNNDENRHGDNRRENLHVLSIDEVVSTQPELGPSVPDGGFGWIVFIATLFFQALLPCLIVNFGIFLAFTKLEKGTGDDKNIVLWDDSILYVPLFFAISRLFFDSCVRTLTSSATSPRLISVVGTCLTCAGLLFMWMGMTANKDYWLFAPAGLLSGLGSSIALIQCETLVAQYFRQKLSILNQISHFFSIMGFLIAPIVLGHHILNTTLTQVLLWYQAIILQGLIASLFFRKPQYLKSKNRSKPYQFVLSNPDDEEDILSKNSRELQIKRQTSTETRVSKIPIGPQPSTSSTKTTSTIVSDELIQVQEDHYGSTQNQAKNWVDFEGNDEDIKYAKLNEWEVFDDDDDDEDKTPKKQQWERFQDDGPPSPRIVNDLSLAEETNTQSANKRPSPLFADFPVNNNDTYAYDDEIVTDTTNANVFVPAVVNSGNFKRQMDVLKEATFYKSLLTMVANTYSSFVFFSLFPSYLYVQAEFVNIRHMSQLVGILSIVNLIFLCIVYWFKIDQKKRAICFWIFYWIGSVGYFMIADFTHEYLLLIGGVQIILSTVALEYTAKPLLRIPVRGGTSNENFLLCFFSSLALLLFVFIDISFKTCFRLVAVLHFFTGSLWLANFFYKKLRVR
ncbi:hypothetical protein Zmor_020111 [Zophobas morio]|uniref:Uncharacterized protein n=1 Tax=Zophobas morio TaxID=2755281 RepID=A0AA38I0X3_9CUCU|nr:hypothetical protein Zmor_020111 [Zophobas morio]